MTRKALVIAILSLVMSAHLTACSSSGGTDDNSVAQSNDQTFAEEGEGDFADGAKTDAAAADAPPTDAPPADGSAVASDAKPEDTGGDLALDGDQPATTPEKTSETAPEKTADASLPADTPPVDAPAAEAAPAVAATDAKPADDLSLDDPGSLPEDTASTSTPPPAENITENPPSPSDAGVFEAPKPTDTKIADAPPEVAHEEPSPAPTDSVTDSAPARPRKRVSSGGGSVAFAPLMKVKDAAFTGPGGATLNRVYIARPKDTTKSISQKVYGAPSHTKDLVKWNPILKRGVRAGDKVYYSSAANPSDGKMMNYYEEAGVSPMTYVSKDGDNLRTVSKSLLGFKDAWKEVWVTNPSVESKGKIPAGLTLTYWPASGVTAPVQTMASTSSPTNSPTNSASAPPTDQTTPSLPSTLPDAAPQVPAQGSTSQANAANAMNVPPADPFNQPPPTGANPPGGKAVADAGAGPDPFAPPPPNDAAATAAGVPPAATGTTGAPDPLAGQPAQNQAAPPPIQKTPPKVKKVAATPADDGEMDSDTKLALGAGGILLLAAAILFVVIKKNRSKQMDLGQTQV